VLLGIDGRRKCIAQIAKLLLLVIDVAGRDSWMPHGEGVLALLSRVLFHTYTTVQRTPFLLLVSLMLMLRVLYIYITYRFVFVVVIVICEFFPFAYCSSDESAKARVFAIFTTL
jgi:hypothetical protein